MTDQTLSVESLDPSNLAMTRTAPAADAHQLVRVEM